MSERDERLEKCAVCDGSGVIKEAVQGTNVPLESSCPCAAPREDEGLREADRLLEKLDGWDVMRTTGDGQYWRGEIARVRALLAASPTAEADGLVPNQSKSVQTFGSAEPSEAEVEAAAKAMHEGGLDAMGDEAQGHLRWDDWVANSGRYFWTAEGYRGLIRTALLAARAVREDK